MGYGAMRLWGRRAPDRSIEALMGQVVSATDAARIAVDVLNDEVPGSEARDRIDDIETAGDQARATLIDVLSSALGPPIDHEDLFRVSRSVDDVLDNLRDFVEEIELFGAEDRKGLLPPLEPIVVALGELGEAIKMLDEDPKAVTKLGLKAQKTAGEVRRGYQASLGELFSRDTVTVDMLRSRELLRRLDVVGLRLQEATAALSDGLMKRGLT
jgi:uncharacterized protein Yka (UPF0111/DUF47 family)